MSFERCVGLEIGNEPLYQQYREAMTPILAKHGGTFRYDFKVSEVLKSETPAPINRVFFLSFKDKEAHDAFFADPDNKQVRDKFFKPSVLNSTILGGYNRVV
jgi:uncharacterized protein (DUF1330 family)